AVRGEKVPATVGTMANGFGQGDDLAALDGQGPLFGAADGAEAAAAGAGLLGREGAGLLLQEGGEGALGQAGGGGGGDLFHRLEVDPAVGAGLAADTACGDLAPAGGQGLDLLLLLRATLALRHRQPACHLRTSRPARSSSLVTTSPSARQTVSWPLASDCEGDRGAGIASPSLKGRGAAARG